MLFQPKLCRLILNRKKTETRRRVQPGKAGAPRQPCYYRPGGNYPLERPMRLDEADEFQRAIIEGTRRGRPPKKEIGRIQIAGVDREPLGDMTVAGARAEGFENPRDFVAYWVRLHDKRWIDKREVTTDPETGTVDVDRHLTDDDLAERFAQRWAPLEVWVIRFELIGTTLYLTERPNRHGDYVTRERSEHGQQLAMTSAIDAATDLTIANPHAAGQVHHAPEEAVHPEIVDSWPSDPTSTHQQIKQDIREGKRTGADHRAAEKRVSTIERRIKTAQATARQRSINVKHEVKVIRQAQSRNRTAKHIEGLVEGLERKLEPQDTPNAA